MLLELKVYYHGLSPLPVQNPYSKLTLGIKSLFVNRFFLIFAAHITTDLVPNIGEKIFCLPPNQILSPKINSQEAKSTH